MTSVRITSPAEYDRHEAEIRFRIKVGNANPSVSVTERALYVACESFGISESEPLVAYAIVGGLLEEVLSDLIRLCEEVQRTYLITHLDVLRITGHEPGLPHVPKRWRA